MLLSKQSEGEQDEDKEDQGCQRGEGYFENFIKQEGMIFGIHYF
jgi:hypothetical protein